MTNRFYDSNYRANVITLAGGVVGFLKENRIEFALTFGTLLGYVRNNDLIAYDYDFDISIFHEDWSHDINTRFLAWVSNNISYDCKMYKPESFVSTIADKLDVSLPSVISFGGSMDIYFQYRGYGYKFDGLSRFVVIDGRNGIYELSESYLKPYRYVDFVGLNVGLPCEPELCVRNIYGENWRKPIEGFGNNHQNYV